MGFFDIRFIDILDILLVATLLYQLYRIIRGTVAINIFIGLFSFLIFWLMVKALKMELTSTILDNLVSVGVLAVIILFQEEIRRFFLLLGTRQKSHSFFSMESMLAKNEAGLLNIYIKPIVAAVKSMAAEKTGALIIIARTSQLLEIVKTGELINGVISTPMLESIFNKYGPLHDGAVIIAQNKIKAARCILPISYNLDLPKHLGLRHRAGLGVSQKTDAQVIVVSEETGHISFLQNGVLNYDITTEQLTDFLTKK